MTTSYSVKDAKLCVEAIKSVSFCQGECNTDEAYNQLVTLNKNGNLERAVSSTRKQLINKTAKLKKERNTLNNKITQFYDEQDRLKQLLREKEKALREEEEKLRKAEQELKDTEAELERQRENERRLRRRSGYVLLFGVFASTVVGAMTFGAGAAPTAALAVAGGGSAAAAAIAAVVIAITALLSKMSDLQKEIKRRNREIDTLHEQISALKISIAKNESEIQDCKEELQKNEMKIKDLEPELARLQQSEYFEVEADNFCQLFQLYVTEDSERTKRLQSIAQKAQEERNITILRTDGTVTVAKSFIEALEEVAIKHGKVLSLN